jgi:hypothetical protein
MQSEQNHWTGAPRSPKGTWAEIDGATRISCTRLDPASACAAFFKESRMQFASAKKFDRKSGGSPSIVFAFV